MKQYLIIGASSGIGASLARQLATEGNSVIGTYNSHPVEMEGVHFHSFNVMDDSVSLGFIPDQLDGLVYCPGAIKLLPFKRIHQEEMLADFQLQVSGAVKVIQAALPALQKKGGSILLFSTVAVQQGYNFHAQVAMSKGAIEGLTRSLAAELAPAIRVNALAPSLTDTPLAEKLLNSPEKHKANADRHPMKRIGAPEDLAQMAAFLLSEKAGWITGQIIHVDGGMSSLKT